MTVHTEEYRALPSRPIKRRCPCGEIVAGKYARLCVECIKKRRRKPATYVWTPERDAVVRQHYNGRRGNSAAIAKKLGWPRWTVSKRAAQLGLTKPNERSNWTKAEEAFLLEHAGKRGTKWMAERLNRSETSVIMKLKREKISRAIREGYTIRELELCFGVDHHVIDSWIRSGKLKARRRDTQNIHNKPFQVSEEELQRFIRENPMAFRLDRVDQLWFVELFCEGVLSQQEVAS